MRVRTLASAPRRARSRHTSVASIANGLPLLIPHQVSHYDVFLGILAFDISTYFISVTIIFFRILCPQFPITQLIAITVSLNICWFAASPFDFLAFHVLLKDQLDVYFFSSRFLYISRVHVLLILFNLFFSQKTHAVLFRVGHTIFLLRNFKTIILDPRKVVKAVYDVEPRDNFSLELVFVDSEWGHLIALHILNVGWSVISLDFLLHFL